MSAIRRSDGATCVIAVKSFDHELYRRVDEVKNEQRVESGRSDDAPADDESGDGVQVVRRRGRPPKAREE